MMDVRGVAPLCLQATWFEMDIEPANSLFAVTVTHRPDRDSASAGAELMR